MVGYKAINVSLIVLMLTNCYDTRYLLVNLDGGNGGGSKELIQPRLKMKGSIGSNLSYKVKRNKIG
jgi:hypothetical protein